MFSGLDKCSATVQSLGKSKSTTIGFFLMFCAVCCVCVSLSHLRLSEFECRQLNQSQKQIQTMIKNKQLWWQCVSKALFDCVTIPNLHWQREKQRRDKIKYICQKCVRLENICRQYALPQNIILDGCLDMYTFSFHFLVLFLFIMCNGLS